MASDGKIKRRKAKTLQTPSETKETDPGECVDKTLEYIRNNLPQLDKIPSEDIKRVLEEIQKSTVN